MCAGTAGFFPLFSTRNNLMKQHLFAVYLAALATVFFMYCSPAWAARNKGPEIQHIVVTSADGLLLLSASVSNTFSTELLNELRSGAVLDFVFSVELVRKGTGWFKDSLRRTSVVHRLRYDQKQDEYLFTTPATEGDPRRTASLVEAEQWMSTFSHVQVVELSSLSADAPYAIHMQAVLKQGMLPFNLGRFVPFWQVSGIQTDRRTIEFRY
jgi:hypothetical protein